MTTYKIIETPFGEQIIKVEENGREWWIPTDPANSDYQAYLNPDKVEHLTEIIPSETPAE